MICAKGIERGSGLLLSDVVRRVLASNPPAALSGPSFAADVGRGLPTAVTLAAESLAAGGRASRGRLATPELRLYQSDDLVGVEIGGAVKNVLAIACGIAQGCGLGRQRGGGADGPRLRRTVALRPGLRRTARDAGRPVGPRRPRSHLRHRPVAQFLARPGAGPGRRPRSPRAAASWSKASPPRPSCWPRRANTASPCRSSRASTRSSRAGLRSRDAIEALLSRPIGAESV